ncbi:hypothetical protein PoB_006160900 [Plakobranchus ocellatus]|uniref:Uncharacterized protein n=1 Tax=Plakobranchus ocellatus TaxID=259542 RepID=A0AAV4CT69_9GAST|nr:hypothetical protein PoB_006160900 [Plakobranchus ocellatus]
MSLILYRYKFRVSPLELILISGFLPSFGLGIDCGFEPVTKSYLHISYATYRVIIFPGVHSRFRSCAGFGMTEMFLLIVYRQFTKGDLRFSGPPSGQGPVAGLEPATEGYLQISGRTR